MQAFRKFSAEMASIEQLYLGTLYAYEHTQQSVSKEVESGPRNPSDPIIKIVSANYKYDTVAANVSNLTNQLNKNYPRHLRHQRDHGQDNLRIIK